MAVKSVTISDLGDCWSVRVTSGSASYEKDFIFEEHALAWARGQAVLLEVEVINGPASSTNEEYLEQSSVLSSKGRRSS